MKKLLVLIPLVALSISSCAIIVHPDSDDNTDLKYTTTQQTTEKMSPTLGGKLFTSAWIQRSAEYKALCQQAYNIATLRLNEALAQNNHTKPLAIITDLDETVFDNTPNCVHNALQGKDFNSQSWHQWTAMGKAQLLKGSLAFFKYAAAHGVEVFYISNRDEKDRVGTLKNLQVYGFPYADNAHLLLSQGNSDKTPRREAVEKYFDVVLFLGDNLGDFSHDFDTTNEATRDNFVEKDKNDFGSKFIILPNPNYGTWEKAMNGGYPSLSVQDKKLTHELLRSY